MFSKSCKYAIRAVLFLATNTEDGRKMGVEELASELDVPKHFLAKILQQLTKNKMISSAKGRNGGFYLNEKNKSSNLLAVIESFEGKGTFTDCVLGLDSCSNENPCPYHGTMHRFRKEFLVQLQNETIEETAQRINTQDLKLQNSLGPSL